MKNVFIVRHCKAEGQVADAPLTGQGIQQALELAEFLSDKGIDHIVSSPYRRACDTIKPLANLIGVEVVMDERLTERILSGRNEPAWRRCFAELTMIWICVMKAGNQVVQPCTAPFVWWRRSSRAPARMLSSCRTAT